MAEAEGRGGRASFYHPMFKCYGILLHGTNSPLIAVSINVISFGKICCANRIHFIYLVHPSPLFIVERVLFKQKPNQHQLWSCAIVANSKLKYAQRCETGVRVDLNECMYKNKRQISFYWCDECRRKANNFIGVSRL